MIAVPEGAAPGAGHRVVHPHCAARRSPCGAGADRQRGNSSRRRRLVRIELTVAIQIDPTRQGDAAHAIRYALVTECAALVAVRGVAQSNCGGVGTNSVVAEPHRHAGATACGVEHAERLAEVAAGGVAHAESAAVLPSCGVHYVRAGIEFTIEIVVIPGPHGRTVEVRGNRAIAHGDAGKRAGRVGVTEGAAVFATGHVVDAEGAAKQAERVIRIAECSGEAGTGGVEGAEGVALHATGVVRIAIGRCRDVASRVIGTTLVGLVGVTRYRVAVGIDAFRIRGPGRHCHRAQQGQGQEGKSRRTPAVEGGGLHRGSPFGLRIRAKCASIPPCAESR